MSTFDEIRTGIQEHVAEILGQFDEVIQQEPWIHLPADYRANYLDEVTEMVAEVALREAVKEEITLRMLHAAANHGQTRLRQAFPDAILYQEFYLLRQAIWSYIRDNHGDSPMAFEAIVRIDTALSLAAKASLRGFYRPAFEARGTWPQTIEDLASDWKTLPPLS